MWKNPFNAKPDLFFQIAKKTQPSAKRSRVQSKALAVLFRENIYYSLYSLAVVARSAWFDIMNSYATEGKNQKKHFINFPFIIFSCWNIF